MNIKNGTIKDLQIDNKNVFLIILKKFSLYQQMQQTIHEKKKNLSTAPKFEIKSIHIFLFFFFTSY